ncbi:phage tail domain-containing protein [Metabacillus idriensis]|uniref:phage tail domain-containing protein n=1 Tax=Metabacillus idriensis TaxID=324768 RepID=UPI0012B0B214|nr:phage tail domain-containing protein [Metabacillus idriensis]
MDVLIEKLNGERKKFSEIGLIPRDFLVSTADVRTYSSEIQGRPGKIDKGADYGPRSITVPFMFEAVDLYDYPLFRDEIYAWLGSIEAFWIYEGRSAGIYKFESPGQYDDSKAYEVDSDIIYGKRYLVRRTSNLAPDQQGVWGLDSISFETVELPFGETTATTLTPFVIGNGEDEVENSIWTVGQAKIFDEEPRYTFTNPTTIQVYNGGTERVDPDEGMHLVIEYKGVSTNLKLKNQTNGSEWSFLGNSVANDSIKIEGVHSALNLLSIVRNTNLELIKLEPGWNTIQVTGATSGTLSFDFRWYFR